MQGKVKTFNKQKGYGFIRCELEEDIYAVENAVASNLSNGFVEGTNSKLKMVKRTMYGRCSKQLLEAKLMYRHNT